MKIEKVDVDYEGISKVISELRQLYEVGDLQTERMIGALISSLISKPYIFIDQ